MLPGPMASLRAGSSIGKPRIRIAGLSGTELGGGFQTPSVRTAMSLWTSSKTAVSTTLPSSSRRLNRFARTGPGSKSAAAAKYSGVTFVAWARLCRNWLPGGHGLQARQVERNAHADDLQYFEQPGQDPGDRVSGRGQDLGGQGQHAADPVGHADPVRSHRDLTVTVGCRGEHDSPDVDGHTSLSGLSGYRARDQTTPAMAEGV
jgi:hypothetical protein